MILFSLVRGISAIKRGNHAKRDKCESYTSITKRLNSPESLQLAVLLQTNDVGRSVQGEGRGIGGGVQGGSGASRRQEKAYRAPSLRSRVA